MKQLKNGSFNHKSLKTFSLLSLAALLIFSLRLSGHSNQGEKQSGKLPSQQPAAPTLVNGGATQHVSNQQKTLEGKTIVLDPGHGGNDFGASRAGVHEKNITLAIAEVLKANLEQLGAHVVMTRTTDISLELEEITQIAHAAQPDAFISIHVNSLGAEKSPVDRVETYCHTPPASQIKLPISCDLARSVHNEVVLVSNTTGNSVQRHQFYVIKHNITELRSQGKLVGYREIPATLLEVGFITKPEKRLLLATPAYQAKLAKAIENGLAQFFAGNSHIAP